MAALILAPASQMGAALHIAAHAVSKITLFFAAGAIYVAAHKTELPQLSGIARQMPITMVAFAIGALSMIGVPPTAGFVSKWFILAGAYQAQLWLVWCVLLLSTLLNAAYFLPILYRAFLLPAPAQAHDQHGEAPWPMQLAMIITAGLTLILFFFHAPLLVLLTDLPGGHP
jgi:multicomponent Na+:H+ antiporter subunit D